MISERNFKLESIFGKNSMRDDKSLNYKFVDNLILEHFVSAEFQINQLDQPL